MLKVLLGVALLSATTRAGDIFEMDFEDAFRDPVARSQLLNFASQGPKSRQNTVGEVKRTAPASASGRNILDEGAKIYYSLKDVHADYSCNCKNFSCYCQMDISFDDPPTKHRAILGIRPLEKCGGEVAGLEAYLTLIDSKDKSAEIAITLVPISALCQSFWNISACIEPYGFKLDNFPHFTGRSLRMCGQLNFNYEDFKIYSLELNCFFFGENGDLFYAEANAEDRPSIGAVNQLVGVFTGETSIKDFLVTIVQSPIGERIGEKIKTYLNETHHKVVDWVRDNAETVAEVVEEVVKVAKDVAVKAYEEVKSWWGSVSRFFGKRKRRSLCYDH